MKLQNDASVSSKRHLNDTTFHGIYIRLAFTFLEMYHAFLNILEFRRNK